MTLVEECNDLPKLDEVGDAMVRRIRVAVFLCSAVSEADYEKIENKELFIVANPFYKTDDFKNTYKQALFEILKSRYTVFKNNNYVLQEQPEICAKKCSWYLATSDDIFTWFKDNYKKDETSNNIIPVSDIFKIFKESEYHNDLTKADKRRYNKTYFVEKIESNVFLRKYVKQRNERFSGKQLSAVCVVNWVYIQGDGEIKD